MTAPPVNSTTIRRSGSRFDFGATAETYDRWYETRKGQVYDVLEKRLVKAMLPRPLRGLRLLDVGCGTGHWSAFFAENGCEVTGVDVAPEMIAAASRKRVAGAAFRVADAHALPFVEGAFDLVASITTLEFVADPEAALAEMVRCARRPGGHVLVGVLNSLAPINAARKANGKPPYADARFFSPGEVKGLLAPYGEARVAVGAFVSRGPAALRLAPLTDRIGRILRGRRGAFIVGRVVL
jgi:SAM-dependent methyltransferase